jgi:DNA polymerase III delta prime subunit
MSKIKVVLLTSTEDEIKFTWESRKFLGLEDSCEAQEYMNNIYSGKEERTDEKLIELIEKYGDSCTEPEGVFKIVEIPSDIEKWDVMGDYYDGVHYEVIVEIGRIFH